MSFYNGIITAKLIETKAFYTETLGFSVKFESDWFLLLEREGRELAFMIPKLENQHEIFQGELEGKGTWIANEVADLEAEYNKVKGQNIEILVEITKEDWGETHFTIADPNGIGIDFVQMQEHD